MLIKSLPRESYPLFMHLLSADFPEFLREELPGESFPQRLPAEFYARALSNLALTPISIYRQSMQDLILQQALQHLDPDQCGLSITLVICVPPRSGGIEVVGADISERMIAYARAQAQVQQRANVSFRVMDILKPLDFPDSSFDLVNARLISGFMMRDKWPFFFREALRVLRPGGFVRLTEPEVGLSNKPYFEKALHIGIQAMNRAGLNFSPNGNHYGIVHMLPYFFRQADLTILAKMAHLIEFSFGTEAHEGFYHDIALALQLFEPLVVKMKLATPEEWRDLSQKGLAEMYEEDFCAAWVLLTVLGAKPL